MIALEVDDEGGAIGIVMALRELGIPALAALGLALFLASPAIAEENSSKIWADDLDTALKNAQVVGRPVLVYVLDSV